MRTVRTPCSAAMRVISSVSAATPLGSPTTSTRRAAADSTGSPAWMYASTACRHSWSIISMRRRDDTGGDHRAHRRGAVLDGPEVHQHRAHRRRVGRQPHADLGGDAEHALAADEDAAQVVADRLGILAAEHGDRAVGQDDLERQDVGVGDPLGQAVRSTGVVGHVAADRARLLAARIRGEVQPVLGNGPREVEVEDARLDPRPARRRVDGEDAVHLRRRDHDGPLRRHGAAGEPGPRAAGDERHAVVARRGPRTPGRRACRSGKQTAIAAPSIPEASWRYSDSSVAPSRTRSGERARRSSSTSDGVARFGRRVAAAVIPAGWPRAGASG